MRGPGVAPTAPIAAASALRRPLRSLRSAPALENVALFAVRSSSVMLVGSRYRWVTWGRLSARLADSVDAGGPARGVSTASTDVETAWRSPHGRLLPRRTAGRVTADHLRGPRVLWSKHWSMGLHGGEAASLGGQTEQARRRDAPPAPLTKQVRRAMPYKPWPGARGLRPVLGALEGDHERRRCEVIAWARRYGGRGSGRRPSCNDGRRWPRSWALQRPAIGRAVGRPVLRRSTTGGALSAFRVRRRGCPSLPVRTGQKGSPGRAAVGLAADPAPLRGRAELRSSTRLPAGSVPHNASISCVSSVTSAPFGPQLRRASRGHWKLSIVCWRRNPIVCDWGRARRLPVGPAS